MDNVNDDLNIIYPNSIFKQSKETQKMIKDLREMFYGVDEKIVNTVVVASDGNMILAYNALLFYTEDKETYLAEMLPVKVVVNTSKYTHLQNKDMLAESFTTSPVKSQVPIIKRSHLHDDSSLKDSTSTPTLPVKESSSNQTSSPVRPPSYKQVKNGASKKKVTSESGNITTRAATTKDAKIKERKKEEYDPVSDDHNKEPMDVENENGDEVKVQEDDYNSVKEGLENGEEKGWTETKGRKGKSHSTNNENESQMENTVVMTPNISTPELDSLLSKSTQNSAFKHSNG